MGAYTYFNDNDVFCCQWLRNLFPSSRVDDSSIVDIQPKRIRPYHRVHLFAGIGGWEYALHLAGWPAERVVWTGSCPCQPFSTAGSQTGVRDPRHLWPEFLRLVRECRPTTIFGEQVTSQLGLAWVIGVRSDLEALGYRVGVADLCAAGVGAPHIRQRLYWVARLGHSGYRKGRNGKGQTYPTFHASYGSGNGVGHPLSTRLERPFDHRRSPQRVRSDLVQSAWTPSEPYLCADGRRRRIEPSLEPLANGVPKRVGRLRGYGNAIVPQVAAVFIRSFLEAEQELSNAFG